MTRRPSVAIVIPVVDGEQTIRRAIESCRSQDYDGPLEVVVALGPSRDGTAAVLSEMEDLVVVDNPSGATPDGLNQAIAATDAAVIVRCDAQSRLPDDYVSTAVRSLEETNAAVVGGRQVVVGTTPLERGIGLAMGSPLGAGGATFRTGGDAGPVETVYLGVFDRAALDAVGGFDGAWLRNQDYELNHRIRTTGRTVWFAPDLAVEYRPRPTLGALWRQFHDYGRWKRAMLSAHPDSFRARQAAAPALVLGLAVTAVAAPWIGWVPSAALLGAYAVALGVGTVVAAPRPGWGWFPVAAATMHLAWGTGFLRGGVGPTVSR